MLEQTGHFIIGYCNSAWPKKASFSILDKQGGKGYNKIDIIFGNFVDS
jgi:hypothetical protein